MKLGPNIIHYLDGVKLGNLQKIYLLSPPEVQCLSLPHDFTLSATSLLCSAFSLFRFQSVEGSVSKFLKAVRESTLVLRTVLGALMQAAKPATNSSKR